jgi:Mn2+/Fe2+ NRAMP family transporter
MIKKYRQFISDLGPGLLYAGAAVGVSHLVMSSKAGAKYEFLLLLLIPIIHAIKYPFFKYGPEYTALTGRNILHGYYALGKWALGIYVVMTLLSMCLIQAAVTIVTSSIAVSFFAISLPEVMMPHIPAIFVLVAAATILSIGQFSLLDKIMKVIMILLTISTFVALGAAIFSRPESISSPPLAVHNIIQSVDMLFIAAFLGWMPAPMEISVWHSVWSEEANRNKRKNASLNKAMLDFNIGFIGTACLAMAFLSLGALVMFGSGEQPSDNGIVFSKQLIEMYTNSMGSWAYPVIGIAALTTMFSTTLTCLDAYPRTLGISYAIWKNNGKHRNRKKISDKAYRIILLLAVIGTVLVFMLIKNMPGAMGIIVTTATIVSFITSPVIALINYRVMQGSTIKKKYRQNYIISAWSWFGIGVMVILTAVYLMQILHIFSSP